MAAATATVVADFPRALEIQDSGAGRRKLSVLFGQITIVGEYATGGVAVTGITKYFKSVERIIITGGPFTAKYDYTNNKVLLYGDNGTATAGALVEPNTVDTASCVYDFVAFGF